MKSYLNQYFAAIIIIFLWKLVIVAQISTGGNFTLEQTVIAGGGGSNSSGANLKIESTIGQSNAGTKGIGVSKISYNGFWTPPPFAPTAAMVTVSGRVSGVADNGLIKTVVTLVGGANPTPIETFADRRGNFEFVNVEVGAFYVITVRRNGYTFVPENYAFNLFDARDDIDFYEVR